MSSGDGIGTASIEYRERIRRYTGAVLNPAVDRLARAGVRPDQVTWAGLALAVIAAVLAGFGSFLAAGIVYLVSGFADFIDGALARHRDGTSRRGAFLDSTLDRAEEGLVHVGAAVAFARIGLWAGVVAVMLSLTGAYLTSYARARAEGLGVQVKEAWVGRGERLVLLAAGLIFHFALIAFWVLAAGGWITAGQRMLLAWRRLGNATEATADELEEFSSTREDGHGHSQ